MTEGKCILVVDDNEKARNNISMIIRKFGYEVVTARNGQEALKTLKGKHCDLLITDLKMPGMTGIDLLKTVRTIKPEIGVIIVTGYGDVESYIQSMNLGAFEYLNKPVNAPELEKIIAKFFNHSEV